MGRRRDGDRRREQGRRPPAWEELGRLLAAAEEDEREEGSEAAPEDSRCPCGSAEFVLEAYLHVVDGAASPEPLETEALTCPQCGREFEGVLAEGGRWLRGAYLGRVDIDESE
jgi:hypothetical protein